eukprot:CAMPEP_0170751496 /NCGR_PEP_ID=MMETSP0437-20130122/11481_1 /TAXON_ID=0 /ORGANISM="Sexangularia sp." /LENGTH=844 /DNA_ID=CAMNT_0011090533 /DNA_START=144 /DNA_END=2678 /DNA_ORIENTATION=-
MVTSRDRPLGGLTLSLLGTYESANSSFRYLPSFNPRRCLTQPSDGVLNGGHDNSRGDYILYVNETLGDAQRPQYRVVDVLGSGTFGQVVRCVVEPPTGSAAGASSSSSSSSASSSALSAAISASTSEPQPGKEYAVKVVKNKPAYFNQGLIEVQILKALNKEHDPDDAHHLVRLTDHFIYRRHLCLVFELLSINLYELIKQNQFRGLSTNLMRVFVAQLLAALAVLERAGIVHCDLKPENVLLESLAAPNVKLIDFGSACYSHQTTYSYIQSRFYRSPEVLFGVPYGPPIDVWSLGCLAAELFLGLPLFPGNSEYDQVRRIVEMCGEPSPAFLDRGKQSLKFFNRRFAPQASTGANQRSPLDFSMHAYELKTAKQFAAERNVELRPPKKYFKHSAIQDIVNNYPLRKSAGQGERERERVARVAFVHFLGGVLELDPRHRWTASQAVHHPFVTGSPLPADGWSPKSVRALAAAAAAAPPSPDKGFTASGPRSITNAPRGAAAEQRRASIAVPMQSAPVQSALTAAVANAATVAGVTPPTSGLAAMAAAATTTSTSTTSSSSPRASQRAANVANFSPRSRAGAALGKGSPLSTGSPAADSPMGTAPPSSTASPPVGRTQAIPVKSGRSRRHGQDPSLAKSPGSFFRSTAATGEPSRGQSDISAFAGTPASLTAVTSFFDPSGMSYPPRRPSSPSLTPQTQPGQYMAGLGAGAAAAASSSAAPGSSAPTSSRLSLGNFRQRGNTLQGTSSTSSGSASSQTSPRGNVSKPSRRTTRRRRASQSRVTKAADDDELQFDFEDGNSSGHSRTLEESSSPATSDSSLQSPREGSDIVIGETDADAAMEGLSL